MTLTQYGKPRYELRSVDTPDRSRSRSEQRAYTIDAMPDDVRQRLVNALEQDLSERPTIKTDLDTPEHGVSIKKDLQDVTDYELGHSMELQYQLIKSAFETGIEERFEQALLQVDSVRGMKRSGILEWFAPKERDD